MFIRNIEELSPQIKTYTCFSPNLVQFLINNNVFPIYKYIHNNKENNKKYVWVFIECDDLSRLLTIWTDNKPDKEGGET
jgi:hypothetical protein